MSFISLSPQLWSACVKSLLTIIIHIKLIFMIQFVSTVQCSSYINMLENVTALQGSHFILLLEFCAVQVKGEIQTGAVEDHSESVQQSYH